MANMARVITSSSEYHSMLAPGVATLLTDAENDMKMMEEETASTVDSSTLLPTTYPVGDYSYTPVTSHTHTSGAIRPTSKGKAMKKMKTDDAEDEEIDIEKCISEDSSRVSVKILRKIIPKLRIACYYSDEQVSGKRKLKHLWDEKPADWPSEVPFKDPNNAIKDTKKPGKEELTPMYEFLRKKYMDKKSFGETGSSSMVYNSPAVTSSNIMHQEFHVAGLYASMGHAQPADDSQGITYMTAAYSVPSTDDSKDTKLWAWSLPEQSHTTFPSEDDRTATVLAPTRPEHPPRALHHQMLSSVPLPDTGVNTWDNQVRQTGHVSNSSSLPIPVTDLYNRLKDKQHKVESLSGHSSEVKVLLAKVQKEVIDCLYEKLASDDTRLCLMFLDAGHQYEALLDVMLVLGKNEGGLLNSGCQEIINKFDKECRVLMMLYQVESRVPGLSMISNLVKSRVYGCDPSIFDMPPFSPAEDEKAKVMKPVDDSRPHFGHEDLSAALGVIKRPAAGTNPELTAHLENFMRSGSANTEPINDTDDKKNLQFEDIMDCFAPVAGAESTEQTPVLFSETAVPPTVGPDSSAPGAIQARVAMGSLHSGGYEGVYAVPAAPSVASAVNSDNGMEWMLQDIEAVIANDVGTEHASASESASSLNSYTHDSYATSLTSGSRASTPLTSGSWAPNSFVSFPWNVESNRGPFQSMPLVSPTQAAVFGFSQLHVGQDGGATNQAMYSAAASSTIPLHVAQFNEDDEHEDQDQRQVGRRRSRQHRGSINVRNSYQNNGRF